MRIDLAIAAAKVRSLSHGERVGVRRYGLPLELWPLTRFALDDASHRQEQIDLSPQGRGEPERSP
jgi:hypothetical protein